MSDDKQTFDEFLSAWIKEWIVALGPRVDPDDREFMAKRRASELTAIARERAWRSALKEKARPYGDVLDYVRELYRSAERRSSGQK